MIQTLTRAFQNQYLLLLVLLILAVGGILSLYTLPITEDPRITNRFPRVVARLPGAPALQMERDVIEPIEFELREVAEVNHIDSIARNGMGVLYLELKDSVKDNKEVFARLRDRLADIKPRLPSTLEGPFFEEEVGEGAFTLILGVVWDGLEPEFPLSLIQRRLRALKRDLMRIDGTEHVEIHGLEPEEVTVTLRDELLLRAGLSLKNIAQQISSHDVRVTGGNIEQGNTRLGIRPLTELAELEQVANLPISTPAGDSLALGFLADVTIGPRLPELNRVLIDQKRGASIALRMQADRRIGPWKRSVDAVIAAHQPYFSDRLSLRILFDQERYTNERMAGLALSLSQAMIGLLLVLSFLMGTRQALVICLIVPLSIGAVLLAFGPLGVGLQQISITGLIISLGLLVDNAIVVADEYSGHRRAGLTSDVAIQNSIHHLGFPLLCSTLTTILSFAPILMIQGPTGEFVGSIAQSVILALCVSLFLSFFLLPPLIENLKFAKSGSGYSNAWLNEKTQRLLSLAARNPKISVFLSSLLPVSGFLLATTLPDQFFPDTDRDHFPIEIHLPRTTSPQAARDLVLQVEAEIRSHLNCSQIIWHLGHSAPHWYYNMIGGRDQEPSYIQGFVVLPEANLASPSVRTLQEILPRRFPEAQFIVRRFGQGPPIAAPIEIRVTGQNLNDLHEARDSFLALMQNLDDVVATSSNMPAAIPRLRFEADPKLVRAAALNPGQIASELEIAMEGTGAGKMQSLDTDLPIRLRLNPKLMADPQFWERFPVAVSGQFVPLGALGRVRLEGVSDSIYRRNLVRTVSIRAWVQDGRLPAPVLKEFLRLQPKNAPLPQNLSFNVGGDAEESSEASQSLFAPLGVLMLLMAGVLILAFQSVRAAALLVVIVLHSVGYGFLVIALSGYPLGFMALIGLAGLIGLAINDSIVVLAEIMQHRHKELSPESTAKDVLSCMRHVLATTATTFAGFLPLMLQGGSFWPPLACAIGFGVIGSTLSAIFFLPSACILMFSSSVINSANDQNHSDSDLDSSDSTHARSGSE